MQPDTAPLVLSEGSARDRFAVAAWNAITAVLESVLEAGSEDRLPAIHAALVLDADAYAAHLAEEIARPDDRWAPAPPPAAPRGTQ